MTPQKIFYVYSKIPIDKFEGYVVASSQAEAEEKACKQLSKPKDQLRVVDTQRTKPKCCPRK